MLEKHEIQLWMFKNMPRPKTKKTTKLPGTFGHQLMTCRKRRGYTQGELADMVGVSQRVISYYENESKHPPSTILIKLAEALGVSCDTLLGRKNGKGEILEKDTILAKKFIEAEELPSAERKTIVSVIDAMLAKHQNS